MTACAVLTTESSQAYHARRWTIDVIEQVEGGTNDHLLAQEQRAVTYLNPCLLIRYKLVGGAPFQCRRAGSPAIETSWSPTEGIRPCKLTADYDVLRSDIEVS
jgi:hypothetical protein